MIHDELISLETAKLARKKGFKEGCLHYYQNGIVETDGCYNHYNMCKGNICSAPTQSLLQRWLREEKGIIVEVIAYPTCSNNKKNCYWWSIKQNSDGICYQYEECSDTLYGFSFAFDTYELALEDALKYALENLV